MQKVSEYRIERLICELTDDEQRDRGQELGQAVVELRSAESTKKSVMAFHKDLVDKAAGKVDELTRVVTTGQETREVRVRDEYDFAKSMVRTVREDTGAVIKSRPMKDDDRQELLPVAEEMRGEDDAISEEMAGRILNETAPAATEEDPWGPLPH